SACGGGGDSAYACRSSASLLGPLRDRVRPMERRAPARPGARGAGRSAKWPGPIAIAGDFNGRGPADEVARAGFSWLTRTLDDRGMFFDFDHVLVRGLCATGNPPAAHADAGGASDHRPVWALVRLCAISQVSGAGRAWRTQPSADASGPPIE